MQRSDISSQIGYMDEIIIKIMSFWVRIRENVQLYLGFNKPLISYIPSLHEDTLEKII